MSRSKATCLGAAALFFALAPSRAHAYTTASLTTGIALPRYAVCKEERTPPPAPAPRASPDEALVPVPRRAPPSALVVVPHLVDDASYAEPIPEAAPSPRAPEAPAIVARPSDNGIHCLGYVRGRAAMMRVLSAPPGTHFYGHPYPRYFIADNMIAASAFDATEAIEPIRRALERPLPTTLAHHEDLDRVASHGHAAMALAELRDRASAPRIRDLVVALEKLHLGTTWRDTLQALVRLDPAIAAAYSLDLVERMARGGAPAGARYPQGHDLSVVLDALDPKDAARALPALQRLSAKGHDECLVVGARLSLGDAALARSLRPDVERDLRTNLATVCYSEIVEALYPGRSLAELPTLLYRGRWRAIADLAVRLRASDGASAARAKALAALRGATTKGPRGLRDHDRVYHAFALAALGDEPSQRELYKVIDAADDEGDGPWIAATYAVRAGLPEALAHAQRRLEIGMRRPIAHGEIEALTSGVAVTTPVRLVRELASRGSALAALGLLLEDAHAREAAMFALSRDKPAEACELVTRSARLARSEDAIDLAFWALTALGDRCRSASERVARDASQPGHVRGMALEHLAMVRAPSVESIARAWEAEGEREPTEAASLRRARIILASPE